MSDQGDICPKGGSINSALKLSIKRFPWENSQYSIFFFLKEKLNNISVIRLDVHYKGEG